MDCTMAKFTDDTKRRLDALIARYPTSKAALLPALWVAQEVYGGWLPPEAMQEVADHLGVPASDVAGVATFYTMYNKRPVADHRIEICQNVACMVNGADELIGYCERKLGIHAGEMTADGTFSVERVECLGACCHAPALMVGSTYYENATEQTIDKLVAELGKMPSESVRPPQSQMPEQGEF